ncbi:MAG: ROK family protein [Christensenellales bacterium]
MIYAGVDIGGTNIKIGLVDTSGKILISSSFKTGADRPFEEIAEDIIVNLHALCSKAEVNFKELGGIGMGIPGTVDTAKGKVVAAANIGWYDIDIVGYLSAATGLKCAAGNDANCAALGEFKYANNKGYRNIVFITLGTGIGSGIIIDGKIFSGMGSAGAEAGHLTLIYDGEPCNCGNKGCWERYASATALINQTRKAAEEAPNSILGRLIASEGKINGKTAFLAKEKGCPVASQVVDKYLEYIGAGLISLSNILHPEAFVIGGGISHEGDHIFLPIKAQLDEYLEKSGFMPYIDVVRASLGNSAGLLGAATLVME